MSSNIAPTVALSNGVAMPQLGLGTWPMDDAEATRAVSGALQMGYRLIDTAENYRNEAGVGAGIRASGVARDQLFITTKFNREWHSLEGPRQACEASLKRLGLDYIDLLLIHWPNPKQDRYVEAFQGLTQLLETGLVRAIGTSNFTVPHLQRLLDQGLVPHVNQIQLDPYHLRSDIVALHQAHGIVTETWSPIGRGGDMLADPAIAAVAKRHSRTPAQVVLRWHTQRGFVPAPKSSDPTRQAQNLNIFDFQLSDDEVAALNALDRPDPNMLDAERFGH
ncbi:aldo/keto reductase [Bordetella muralis]|uniref:aldo/keto reductase n=1 Tax=Bordetella muralis TaxID=1649130 RepID=UPI0039EE67EF